MNISLDEIGNRICKFFNDQVERIARETKFVQRKSKLTGTKFLQALIFGTIEKKEMSLTDLSESCLDLEVEITPQGLDERFSENSQAFMKEMFSQAMTTFQNQEGLPIPLLQQFSGVYLIDSSQISLPETMQTLFPGSGGNASTASLKIQLVFDFLSGQLSHLDLVSGRESDQGYREHWKLIQKAALYLMDLGYFVLDTFNQIAQQEAFFLSRYLHQTGLLTPDGKSLDLKRLLVEQTSNTLDLPVLLGSRPRHRIPCRLIALRLPQEAADRRRQKAKENAQRHGRTLTHDYLFFLGWAIFVTNLPSAMLKAEHVARLYRVRWQIELIFKLCKSFAGFKHLSSLRPQRILTEFYARLIGLILTCFLLAPLRMPDPASPNRELSLFKARSILQRFTRDFLRALSNPSAFLTHLLSFFRHLSHSAFKQKRHNSPNLCHALALISALYHWDSSCFSNDLFLSLSLVCLPVDSLS